MCRGGQSSLSPIVQSVQAVTICGRLGVTNGGGVRCHWRDAHGGNRWAVQMQLHRCRRTASTDANPSRITHHLRLTLEALSYARGHKAFEVGLGSAASLIVSRSRSEDGGEGAIIGAELDHAAAPVKAISWSHLLALPFRQTRFSGRRFKGFPSAYRMATPRPAPVMIRAMVPRT